MNIKLIITTLILIAVLLGIYFMSGKTQGSTNTKNGWTVFGTTGCSWTTKQLAEMETKGITYKFVDCDKESQNCVGMSGFPTLKNDDGTVKVGFTPM
jgi:disulfide bond formation protein DsbB